MLTREEQNARYVPIVRYPHLNARGRPCGACGRMILEWKGEKAPNAFCDRKCSGKYKSTVLVGKNSPMFKGGIKTYACDNCGAAFEREYGQVGNWEKRFCKRACHAAYQKANPVSRTPKTSSAFWPDASEYTARIKALVAQGMHKQGIARELKLSITQLATFLKRECIVVTGEYDFSTPANFPSRKGADHPRYKPPVAFSCAYCGAAKTRPSGQLKGIKNPCCDKACRIAFERKTKRVPANSSARDPDSALIDDAVERLVEQKLTGPQIMDALHITVGVMAASLKRKGLVIARNIDVKKGKDSKKWIERVLFECAACKKKVEREPYNLNEGNNFCGRECKLFYQRSEVGPDGVRVLKKFTRDCANCGKTFKLLVSTSKNQCCSRACSSALRTKTVEQPCLTCGKMFNPLVLSGLRKFCSKPCSALSLDRKISVACAHCGTAKRMSKAHVRGKRWYCSSVCFFTFRSVDQQANAEFKDNLSKSIRRKWTNDKVWAAARRSALSKASAEMVSKSLIKQSSAEILMMKIMRELAIEFIEQWAVTSRATGLTKVYDFYLPAHDALLEVHGTFWHADPRFYPDRTKLSPVQKVNIKNDAAKEKIACDELGATLVIAWEDDLHKAPGVIMSVLESLPII